MRTMEPLTDLRHQQIAKLAYEIWEKKGRPAGSSEQDWFEAERMVDFAVPANLPFGAFSLEADE